MKNTEQLFDIYNENFKKYVELFKEKRGMIISSDYFESVSIFTEKNIIEKKNNELKDLIKELKDEKN